MYHSPRSVLLAEKAYLFGWQRKCFCQRSVGKNVCVNLFVTCRAANICHEATGKCCSYSRKLAYGDNEMYP